MTVPPTPFAPAAFPGLSDLADLSALAPSPAEAHGIYCGLLCGDASGAREHWLSELLLPAQAPNLDACRAELIRLAEHTHRQLQGPEGRFVPLLPDIDRPLPERAEAVHDWSRGFLYGLGLTHCDPNRLNGSAREALEDLSELTRLDLADLDDSEDNEAALVEITEFLWVAAMLIHQERACFRPDAQPHSPN
jgi:uncharacterized protein YgfB (UPF0149 family)